MNETECQNMQSKSKCKHSNQSHSVNTANEEDNDHDWWASDSGSSTGSYYSDTVR